MVEGGVFPWKLQKILQRGPVADYSGLRDPLPPPPKGMVWHQDAKTREWKLIPKTEEEPVPELKEETTTTTVPCPSSIVVEGKLNHINNNNNVTKDGDDDDDVIARDEEWEVLSERGGSMHSASGGGGAAIVVPRAGSVRSINSIESSSNLSVPFKIQRTTSSSTIDSADGALGPSGKGVLGVDYVEHVVMPTDTLQGICLAYKIGSTKLRQANHFSGNSLVLAPKKLIIPLSKKALRSGYIRVQDTASKEYKIHAFQAQFPKLSMTEAKAYLELADWVLEDAVQSAREDGEWEKEMKGEDMRGGEIRITVSVHEGIPVSYKTKGAGVAREKPPLLPKPISQEEAPLIASKSVKANDVYKAANQHGNFGVELQPIV